MKKMKKTRIMYDWLDYDYFISAAFVTELAQFIPIFKTGFITQN